MRNAMPGARLLVSLIGVVLPGTVASAAEDEPTGPPAPNEWVVAGQAVDGAGAGVAGAAVQVEAGGSAAAEGRVLGRATTDRMGDFRIRLPGEPKEKLFVRVKKERFATSHEAVEFGEDEREAFVSVSMTGALVLRGTVFHAATSRPVKDAPVSLETQGCEIEARTDERGRFELRGASEGPARLTVASDGFGRERRPLRVEPDMPDIQVLLYPERPLRVRVVDERGQPVPEADVFVLADDDSFSAATDRDGYTDIHGIGHEVTEVQWRVVHPGGVRMSDFDRVLDLSGELPAPGTSRPATTRAVVYTLVLPRGGRIAGTIVDAVSGEPVLTARVMIADAPGGETLVEWTDAEGRFEIGGIVPGPIAVAVHHSDYAPELIEDEARAGWTRQIPVRLVRGRPLAGTVVDEQGKPLAGVQAVCTRWRNRNTAGLRAITDENGRFQFDHAPDGPLEFSFRRSDGGQLRGQVLTAGKTDYRITLKPEATRPAVLAGSPVGEPQNKTEPGSPLQVGKPAPDFTVKALDGTTYKLSQLRGKYVFVDVWATWCPPCRAEMPTLRKLHAEVKDRRDFIMLGISLDDDADTVKAFAAKEKITWPLVAGPDSGADAAAERFGAKFIPFNFLVGPDGKVLGLEIHGDDLADRIRTLTKTAASK